MHIPILLQSLSSILERELERGYVPILRSVEEIFEEDERHADEYREVANDDEGITVDGPDLEVLPVME